jgi:predicted DNA-binding transcriptional regulator YafY
MKKQTIGEKVRIIREAIDDGVAIILGSYHSVKSKNVSDRNVVPLKIKGDCVLCFDLDRNGEWRQFKFERIQGNVKAA